ncbi:CRISPR-associated protein Csx18 [Myxosarcina sp. GI1]|uniref:CRISPR-associated protein Csx18 n=1 Tax=Myxosarcina sp. GI1 TaxID=1541065 RepID=UPI00055D8944|nr:CRISPR-associated protein Csx18 [Myxosarcina sp. GI1]
MYISTRAAVVRNLATAITNGAITLTLLLIAPLGLAAVVGNTFFVTVASFFVGVFADMVVSWLSISPSRQNRFSAPHFDNDLSHTQRSSEIQKRIY